MSIFHLHQLCLRLLCLQWSGMKDNRTSTLSTADTELCGTSISTINIKFLLTVNQTCINICKSVECVFLLHLWQIISRTGHISTEPTLKLQQWPLCTEWFLKLHLWSGEFVNNCKCRRYRRVLYIKCHSIFLSKIQRSNFVISYM